MNPGSTLILMKGPPGTGKSSLARELARRTRSAYVDKDRFRDLLEEGGAEQGDATELAYEGMWRVSGDQLASGLNVVADSPLSDPRSYARGLELAAAHGARALVVQVICSDPLVWRARVDTRQNQPMLTHHTSSWEKLQRYLQRIGTRAEYPITVPVLLLDTVNPLDELAQTATAWVHNTYMSHPESKERGE